MVDRERALGFELPWLVPVFVLDVIDADAEVDADAETERFDPERETDSCTDRCKNVVFTRQRNLKEKHTLFKSSFDPTLEFTLDPELDLELPLRLDDGLFSSFCPFLDLDFDLDDPLLLLPLVDADPDLLKLRLRLAVLDASASPSNPTSGTGTCSRCCTRSCWRMSGT